MVQPLLDQMNKKESLKQVEKHLESFSTISKLIVITDLISTPSGTRSNEINHSAGEPGDKLLKKMELADNINDNVSEYISWICEKINSLDSIHRKLVLHKYYYKADPEEIETDLGISKRMQGKMLKEAELQLAILMNEAIF